MLEITISRLRSYKMAKATLAQAIEHEEKSYFIQGMCLYKIKEEGWWSHEYESFDEFCKKEYDRRENWAYKQIAAYEAAADVNGLEVEFCDNGETNCTMVQIENERQARELSRVETMQERANVIHEVAKEAPVVDGKPKITAAAIKRAIQGNGQAAKKPTSKAEPEVTGRQWCGHQAKQLAQIRVDIDQWKKKHAKTDPLWQQCLDDLDKALVAFKKLGKK